MNATTLMFISIMVIGLVYIILALVQLMKAKRAEKTWPTATARVISSAVGTHLVRSSQGGAPAQFMPEVAYEYQVNGITYQGSRVGFGKVTMSRKKATQVVEKYPSGSAMTVFCDPQDVAKAVLETRAFGFANHLALGIH